MDRRLFLVPILMMKFLFTCHDFVHSHFISLLKNSFATQLHRYQVLILRGLLQVNNTIKYPVWYDTLLGEQLATYFHFLSNFIVFKKWETTFQTLYSNLLLIWIYMTQSHLSTNFLFELPEISRRLELCLFTISIQRIEELMSMIFMISIGVPLLNILILFHLISVTRTFTSLNISSTVQKYIYHV